MKVYSAGKIKPGFLDQDIEVQPYESYTGSNLKRLNFIIGFVQEQKANIRDGKYIDDLEEQYKKLVENDFVEKLNIDYKKIINKLVHLKGYPNLAKLSLNFYMQTIEFSGTNWLKDKVKVKNKNQLLGFLLPRYYNLAALIETLGREDGIKLYKRYVTHYYIDELKTRENRYESIEEFFANRNKPDDNPSEWSIYYGLIDDGKYFYRNNNCTWVEALKDYPDNEMKYLICCYGDYEGAKFHNKNFILTMEHTIAQGHPYCSRVIHDTRVDYNLRHPSKEFWDSLNDKVVKK